jgi:tetratricopeptide (TPR) repeat protein
MRLAFSIAAVCVPLLAQSVAQSVAPGLQLEHAWSLAATGHRAEAIQLVRQIVSGSPNQADAHLLLGSLLMEEGDKQGSLDELNTAVRLRPRSADAQNTLGEACVRFNQPATARGAFERAVALKPDFGIAHLNLGTVLLAAEEADAAAKHLNRAIALLGTSDEAADALYARARIHTQRNETEPAAKLLERAVKVRRNFAEAWSELGMARKLLLDDAGCLDALNRAVSLNPRDGVAQYRLGAEYLAQDKPGEALPHLQIARQLNPADQSTLNALQSALRKTGDEEGAKQIRQQLAELLRDRDQTNQNRLSAIRLNNDGAALEKSGDLKQALEKYREAARLDPSHAGIQINLAVALLRTGQWTEGLERLHAAWQRDPENQQLKAALKDALAQAPPASIPSWGPEVRQK